MLSLIEMDIAQKITLICWAIFVFYWISNWWRVKPTQEKPPNGLFLRGMIVGIIALVLLNRFVFHITLPWPACQSSWLGCNSPQLALLLSPLLSLGVSQSLSIQIASIVLALLGLGIAIVARKTLAENWSPTLDVKKGHELITRGIYHYIRHPIYTGMLLMMLATLLAFQSKGGLLIILFATTVFLFRIRAEEALMTKTFPNEYPAYKKRTNALIPFIF